MIIKLERNTFLDVRKNLLQKNDSTDLPSRLHYLPSILSYSQRSMFYPCGSSSGTYVGTVRQPTVKE